MLNLYLNNIIKNNKLDFQMFYLKKIVHHKALLENPGIDQPQLKVSPGPPITCSKHFPH